MSITITLSDKLKNWAQTQAQLGGYDSIDEFVSQVLREERKRQSIESLELKLLEAVGSGPARLMSDEDWKTLKDVARRGKKGSKRHAAQH